MSELELFDTCAVSYVVNAPQRHPRLAERLDRAQGQERAYISELSVFELRRGVAKLKRRGEGKRKAAEVERTVSRMKRLPLDETVFLKSVELWLEGQAKKPAVVVADPDLFIAATAAAGSMVLVTTDKRLADRLHDLRPELSVETS